MKERIEKITDVPSEDLEQVKNDFERCGAAVKSHTQPNGKHTITAYFDENSFYVASGLASI